MILSDDEKSLSGESVQRMYILSMPFLSNNEEDSISRYHHESLQDVNFTECSYNSIQELFFKYCRVNLRISVF